MDNQKTPTNPLWLIVVFVLLLALIAGVVFFFANPNRNSGLPYVIKTTLSPEEKMTQEVLYNPTPQPGAVFKPADKIIIKTVNFDTSGSIAEIMMFVPAAMVDGTITVEGKQVNVQPSQQGNAFVLSFLVPDELRKKAVTFLVHKDGKQIATCSLSLVNNESLAVNGDCVF